MYTTMKYKKWEGAAELESILECCRGLSMYMCVREYITSLGVDEDLKNISYFSLLCLYHINSNDNTNQQQ